LNQLMRKNLTLCIRWGHRFSRLSAVFNRMLSCLLRVHRRAPLGSFRCISSANAHGTRRDAHTPSGRTVHVSERHIDTPQAPCAQKSQISPPPAYGDLSRQYKYAIPRSPKPRRDLSFFISSPRSSLSTHIHTASMSTAAAKTEDQYRLPTNVKATHYDVTVKTDLEGLAFQGLVKIRYASDAFVEMLQVLTAGIQSRCQGGDLQDRSQHV
jgi:hypothetical protein